MNHVVVLLLVVFLSTVGLMVIKLFGLLPKKNIRELLSYSYGLGVGLIAIQLYLYARLQISWTVLTLGLPWILVIAAFLILNIKSFHIPVLKFPVLTKLQVFLLSAIILAGWYTFFEVLLRPVAAWDAWAIWLLKAKIFFIDQTIHPSVLTYVKSDYPLVISLLGTFVYLVLGRVNDTAVLLPFFAFYFFLALSFYYSLRRKYNRTYSLLFTLLLVSTQTLIRQGGRIEAGQADLAVGFYGFLSFTLLLEYLQTSSTRILMLLNIFLALTGLVKFDGIPITAVIGFFELLFIFKRKLYKHFFAVVFWLIPLADWEIYKRINHVTKYTYFAGHIVVFSMKNTVHVISREVKELVNITSWNMLWIVYFYTLFFQWTKKHAELVMLHTLILTQLFIYTFLYLFTEGNSPESSFERLLVHVAPLALYSVALSLPAFLSVIQITVLKKYSKKFI